MNNSIWLQRISIPVIGMMFLLSSLDLVGSMNVAGFSFRIVYVFTLSGMILVSIKCIADRKVSLPQGFVFLGIWCLLMIFFIPNSPLLVRNIGYVLWLLMNVGIIFMVNTFMDKKNIRILMILYAASFFVQSLFGIVQYITPQIGLPALWVQQWWIPNLPRVNGFTYEPSYFSTYLLLGLPMLVILSASSIWKNRTLVFMYVASGTGSIALMFGSSRMGIFVYGVFVSLFVLVAVFIQARRRRFMLQLNLAFIIPLLCLVGALFVMDQRIQSMGEPGADHSKSVYLRDLAPGDGPSIHTRLKFMEKTFEVFLQNPFVGVSLGGIAPWIAARQGIEVRNNGDVKPFEGANIFLEVLAASGITGFLVFLAYVVSLFIPAFSLKYKKSDPYRLMYFALIVSLVMVGALLMLNQNILRTYLWVHIAMVSGVIKLMKQNEIHALA